MKIRKPLAVVALAAAASLTLGACSEANTASQNNRAAADNFEIQRRIVSVNGITGESMLEIEGRCSVTDETGKEGGAAQLDVICKVGDDEFKSHKLGLSDNVSYVVEQTEANPTDAFHYRFILRPETVIPNVDVETSNG